MVEQTEPVNFQTRDQMRNKKKTCACKRYRASCSRKKGYFYYNKAWRSSLAEPFKELKKDDSEMEVEVSPKETKWNNDRSVELKNFSDEKSDE